MTLEELANLIKIKEYVANAIGISSIDRKTVNELNDTLLLLDKKIIGLITGNKFKEYIGYENVKQVKMDAAKITNIFHGIKDKK